MDGNPFFSRSMLACLAPILECGMTGGSTSVILTFIILASTTVFCISRFWVKIYWENESSPSVWESLNALNNGKYYIEWSNLG